MYSGVLDERADSHLPLSCDSWSVFWLRVAVAMTKYSKEPENTTKSCKERGSDLRVREALR